MSLNAAELEQVWFELPMTRSSESLAAALAIVAAVGCQRSKPLSLSEFKSTSGRLCNEAQAPCPIGWRCATLNQKNCRVVGLGQVCGPMDAGGWEISTCVYPCLDAADCNGGQTDLGCLFTETDEGDIKVCGRVGKWLGNAPDIKWSNNATPIAAGGTLKREGGDGGEGRGGVRQVK